MKLQVCSATEGDDSPNVGSDVEERLAGGAELVYRVKEGGSGEEKATTTEAEADDKPRAATV